MRKNRAPGRVKQPAPGDSELRRAAEERLRASPEPASQPQTDAEADAQRLYHELQVHQVELQLQNDELLQAQARLEASLSMYADLFDFAPVGYFTIDGEGKIWEVNLNGAALLGTERARLVNRRFGLFVSEDTRQDFNAFLTRVFSGKAKSGCVVTLAVDGKQPCIVQIEGAAVENGQCRMAVMDITERQKLEAALVAAQKMASLGTLAAGVAHEINSPLQVITGLSESLLKRSQGAALEKQDLDRSLETINRNAWRLAEITRALAAFTHAVSGETGPADLNEIVQATLVLLEHRIQQHEGVQVRLQLAAQIPPLVCDRSQLAQVLINLVDNAYDAMPEGGDITIHTGYDTASQSLLLAVHDSGPGIPDEIRSTIFDPFFTTKPVGAGMGLGLSIVMSIVRAYGGDIQINSNVGQGTQVVVRFPEAAASHPPQAIGGAVMGRYRNW